MKGDPKVISLLNEILVNELTAVSQYLHHAHLLEDWGLDTLAEHEDGESLEERLHAKRLARRILFLGGTPEFGRLNALRIGDSIESVLRNDLAMEIDAVAELKEAMNYCQSVSDFASQDLLKDILIDEENHVGSLEGQLSLLQRMGEQNYIASHYSGAMEEGAKDSG